jgi:hypothetical protein
MTMISIRSEDYDKLMSELESERLRRQALDKAIHPLYWELAALRAALKAYAKFSSRPLGDVEWIKVTDELPPYGETLWLTVQATHIRGFWTPNRPWQVVRGKRHATNASGEVWFRADAPGEMAWNVFSWSRFSPPVPAVDARAGKEG